MIIVAVGAGVEEVEAVGETQMMALEEEDEDEVAKGLVVWLLLLTC